jgi:hypothetical protein
VASATRRGSTVAGCEVVLRTISFDPAKTGCSVYQWNLE